MFRMSSPWDRWAWMRPDDDEVYAFAPPLYRVRPSSPFEGYALDEDPTASVHQACRRSRRPEVMPAAFAPGYPRQPRRQNFFPAAAPAAHGMYDMDDLPYGYHYSRRPAPPEPAFYPIHSHVPLRIVPQPASDDADLDELAEEHGGPVLLHDGYGGYMLKRPPPPSRRRQQQHQRQGQQQQQQQPAAAKPRAFESKSAADSNSASGSDTDNGDGNDHNDHNRTGIHTGVVSKRHGAQPYHPVLLWDPVTGLCLRAMPDSASAANSTAGAATRSVAGSPNTTAATAAKTDRAQDVLPSVKRPVMAHISDSHKAAKAAVASSPPPSSTPPTARTATGGAGPTRIHVRTADSASATTAKVPVLSAAASSAKVTEPMHAASLAAVDAATAAATVAAAGSLERQTSTALVTRPSMEISLSRGPSAVLPSAAPIAAAATGATNIAVTAAGTGAAAPAAVAVKNARGKGPFAAAAAAAVTTPSQRMTRSQAARTIQRWWRGWRLWRHTPALRQLVALARELRDAAALYYSYMGATDGNITTKQQFEINELAMRAILKLDSLEGLPTELRALRKHLTARALRLQDEIHSAYVRSSGEAAAATVLPDAPTATADANAIADFLGSVVEDGMGEAAARIPEAPLEEELPPQAPAAVAGAAAAALQPTAPAPGSTIIASGDAGEEMGPVSRQGDPDNAAGAVATAAATAAAKRKQSAPVGDSAPEHIIITTDAAAASGEDSQTQTMAPPPVAPSTPFLRPPSSSSPGGGAQQEATQHLTSSLQPQLQQQSHVHFHVKRRPRLVAWHKQQQQRRQHQCFAAAAVPAAATACGRAVHAVSKHVNATRGVGSKAVGTRCSNRGSQADRLGICDHGGGSSRAGNGQPAFPSRWERRLSPTVVAAATGSAGRAIDSNCAGLDKWALRRQQQKQQPVVLRIVVRAGGDGVEDDGRVQRTTLLVETGVQTD